MNPPPWKNTTAGMGAGTWGEYMMIGMGRSVPGIVRSSAWMPPRGDVAVRPTHGRAYLCNVKSVWIEVPGKKLLRKERTDFLVADDFQDPGIEVSLTIGVGDRLDLDPESFAFRCKSPALQQAEKPSVFGTVRKARTHLLPYSFMSVPITSSALTSVFLSSVTLRPRPMMTNLSTIG